MAAAPVKLFDVNMETMQTWQLAPLKEYSGTGMSWVRGADKKAPRVEISGAYRFPFAFDVGKDKQIVRGEMNRISGILNITDAEAEKLAVFDQWADWAHDTNKQQWWGATYPRRGFQLNEVVKRSYRKDREAKDPRNPYKMDENGQPIEDMSLRFKATYRYPSDTRFRLAGVWDDDAGGIVEAPAFQKSINRRTGEVVEGADRQMTPAPPEWNETRFLIVDEESGNTFDKTVVMNANGENAKCSKTGRFLYRFFGPEDVVPGSTITKIVLEVNALYFSGGTGRGVSFKAREVHFKPRRASAAGGGAAAAGGGGGDKYNPADHGAAAPPPPGQAAKMAEALAAASRERRRRRRTRTTTPLRLGMGTWALSGVARLGPVPLGGPVAVALPEEPVDDLGGLTLEQSVTKTDHEASHLPPWWWDWSLSSLCLSRKAQWPQPHGPSRCSVAEG